MKGGGGSMPPSGSVPPPGTLPGKATHNGKAVEVRGEVMRGARIIVESLIKEGVDILFGYPGGAILHVYDELHKQQARIRHVLVRHEQGAVHAAEGFALSTGRVGVCMVTSGPGATNVVTGLQNAMMDSTPIVVISGQVPRALIGTDGFQEADIVGITRPCTKYNYLVKDVKDLARLLTEAFYLARSGRPGPVLVDIPKDVTAEEYEFVYPETVDIPSYKPTIRGHGLQVKKAVELMQRYERTILYAGGGVVTSGAEPELYELARRLNAPVTPTLMGLGCFPATDRKHVGMLGMHGTYTANMAMAESELIVAIGARFDDRVTGAIDKFALKARKIHIDIDPTSLNKNIHVDVPIVGDAKTVLGQILEAWGDVEPPARDSWWATLDGWRKKYPLAYKDDTESIKPQRLFEELARQTEGRFICSTDVGQHQMWAAQYYPATSGRKWLTSGGLGTMGFGLPAAMGAAMTATEPVICVTGDGSFQMCIQELATCVHEGLDVKVVIMNNNYLGMVRQWQEMFYSRRYSEVGMKYFPDFVRIAEAYGATGLRAEKPEELEAVLKKGFATKGTVIMDVIVHKESNVFPMLPAGAPHYHIVMDPEVFPDYKLGDR
jgi:acetolactate synthase I/II/III large subunit